MCTKAQAGAWAPEAGAGQTILKYESTRSTRELAYGRSTDSEPASEASPTLWRERGLTDQLTVQTKVGAVEGYDENYIYWGEAPTEVGARYAVVQGERTSVAVYGGVMVGGIGRNAIYARRGRGAVDLELRVLAGRSMKIFGRETFGEVQVARLFRSGLADEMRLDATAGVEFARAWRVLVQTYAERAEEDLGKPVWLKGEVSVVRRIGSSWRVQAGWRQTLTGRHVPLDHGPVVALWLDF